MFKILFSKKYWEAILLLISTTINSQNRNTLLGSIWGLIQPFLHIIVIAYFFGFLLRQSTETMVENLVGALPFWTFLMSGLTISAGALISRENILKRTIISKTYFPIADSLAQAYTLAYSFVAMYVALIIFYPEKFTWNIIFIPIFALPLIFTVMASGVALAFLTPYIRDIPQLINVILGVVYWTVPIIYPVSLIPESKRILFDYHPIYLLIRPMQTIVTTGQLPSLIYIFKSWIVCGASIVVSYFIYKKLSRNVIYYL